MDRNYIKMRELVYYLNDNAPFMHFLMVTDSTAVCTYRVEILYEKFSKYRAITILQKRISMIERIIKLYSVLLNTNFEYSIEYKGKQRHTIIMRVWIMPDTERDRIKDKILLTHSDMKTQVIERPDGFIINPLKTHEEFCKLSKQKGHIMRFKSSNNSIRVWW